MKHLSALLGLLLLPVSLGACAHGERLVEMEVVDAHGGHALPLLPHRGRDYIAGEPGRRFSVALRNVSGERVLAVLSVDGVNAISGQTAATAQTGYVLEPWQRIEVNGWRKNYSEVAQFYFTDLPDSYAALTDRPGNVGVIGVAVFRERHPEPVAIAPPAYAPPPTTYDQGRAESSAQAAPSAKAQSSSGHRHAAGASADSMVAAQELGTGHGERRYDPVARTHFERRSSRPDQRVSLYYDSPGALAARGIIPAWRHPSGDPDPFPGGFARDPH